MVKIEWPRLGKNSRPLKSQRSPHGSPTGSTCKFQSRTRPSTPSNIRQDTAKRCISNDSSVEYIIEKIDGNTEERDLKNYYYSTVGVSYEDRLGRSAWSLILFYERTCFFFFYFENYDLKKFEK